MSGVKGPIAQLPVPGGIRQPAADGKRVLCAFLATYAPLAFVLFVPYSCIEASSLGCADGYTWQFVNTSGERITITPYYLDDSQSPQPLVMHGFQRGRFALEIAETRELHLELGDYDFDGLAVEFSDGLVRLLHPPPSFRPIDKFYIEGRDRQTYPLAPRQIAVVNSAWSLAADRLYVLAALVLLPPLPIAFLAAMIARSRSREERLLALRAAGLSPPAGLK